MILKNLTKTILYFCFLNMSMFAGIALGSGLYKGFAFYAILSLTSGLSYNYLNIEKK